MLGYLWLKLQEKHHLRACLRNSVLDDSLGMDTNWCACHSCWRASFLAFMSLQAAAYILYTYLIYISRMYYMYTYNYVHI